MINMRLECKPESIRDLLGLHCHFGGEAHALDRDENVANMDLREIVKSDDRMISKECILYVTI